jgi:hypothetical protein
MLRGIEFEKLPKDAIVKPCRFFYAQIKDFRNLLYNAGADIIYQLRQISPDTLENYCSNQTTRKESHEKSSFRCHVRVVRHRFIRMQE